MSRLTRFATITLSGVRLLVTLPGIADAQRRAVPRHPPHPPHAVVVRGHVFIGGYFYDPFYGPYPWWPRTAYPYWYFPVYDNRAEVLLRVEPKEAEDAAVYVDGFYAGVVDDFNGVFLAPADSGRADRRPVFRGVSDGAAQLLSESWCKFQTAHDDGAAAGR